eukprot:6417053-Alexandrium_andersonii.AAC.1
MRELFLNFPTSNVPSGVGRSRTCNEERSRPPYAINNCARKLLQAFSGTFGQNLALSGMLG